MYFKEAYNKTMKHEGFYSNDPTDRGGETYKGIARNRHPHWVGWIIIDRMKDDPNFPECLKSNKELNDLVPQFYKEKFWDKFKGDEITSKIIAMELFDTSVNMGYRRAIKFLQESLNALNRNEKNYFNISEDGIMGPQTLATLKNYLSFDSDYYVFLLMNILQGKFYIDIMKNDETQEKYARGWLSRVILMKD